jgi:hypothetical protein
MLGSEQKIRRNVGAHRGVRLQGDKQARPLPKRDLCGSPLICHSEGAERPKNLITTRKCEILRGAQDDKNLFAEVSKRSIER